MKKILLILISTLYFNQSFGSVDSTIIPSTGIAGITSTSDSTSDTLNLSRFIEIEDITVMDVGISNILTVSMEEGDLNTYVVVRYNLLDYKGKQLYTNRYRISGSCYDYFLTHGLSYVFWKICNEKGFVTK